MADLDLYRILEMFLRFDLNDNGTIEMDELTAVIRKLDPDGWPDNKIRELFASMDLDRSEHVDYEEFLKWVWGETPSRDVDSVLLRNFMNVVDPEASLKGQTSQPEVEGSLMRGSLGVQRKTGRDQRYFVLYKGHLDYHANVEDLEASSEPRGRLVLDDIEELEEVEDGFNLLVGGRRLELKVCDPNDLQKWLSVLVPLMEQDLKVEEPVMRGSLDVQRKTGRDQRYFVLYKSHLDYYANAQDLEAGCEPRGQIVLDDIEELEEVEDGISLLVKGRRLELKVRDPRDLQKWLDALDPLVADLLEDAP